MRIPETCIAILTALLVMGWSDAFLSSSGSIHRHIASSSRPSPPSPASSISCLSPSPPLALPERGTYVLVKKLLDEEGNATYKYLGEPPTRFRETAFTA